MIDIVLADLDQTLCNAAARSHLAPEDVGESDNWIPYSKGCATDVPISGPITTLRYLARNLPVFIVSGRNVEAYIETRTWLTLNQVPFDNIRLRGRTDIRSNAEFKVDYIGWLREHGFNPVLMFEDNVGVSEAVEAVGVPVVTVNPRYDDPVGVSFNKPETSPTMEELLDA